MNNKCEKLLKLIEDTRKKHQKYEDSCQKMLNIIDKVIPDADKIDTDAYNASNLLEAILCYVQYDEYTLDEISEEIEAALNKM